MLISNAIQYIPSINRDTVRYEPVKEDKPMQELVQLVVPMYDRYGVKKKGEHLVRSIVKI